MFITQCVPTFVPSNEDKMGEMGHRPYPQSIYSTDLYY